MRKGKDVHNRDSASGRSQNVKFFKNRLTAQDVHYFRMEGVPYNMLMQARGAKVTNHVTSFIKYLTCDATQHALQGRFDPAEPQGLSS
jgi:hypothetical protein